MARVTVEDCLEHVENRFDLVLKAAERAHTLEQGGADPIVERDNDKPTVIALREIAAGLLSREPEEPVEGESPEIALANSYFTNESDDLLGLGGAVTASEDNVFSTDLQYVATPDHVVVDDSVMPADSQDASPSADQGVDHSVDPVSTDETNPEQNQ